MTSLDQYKSDSSRQSVPLVSIVIASYNQIDSLIVLLDSILDQTHQNIEIVVVDDCSTDGTPEYLDTKYRDKIVLIKNEANRGWATPNQKLGYQSSHGDYVVFADHDDYFIDRNWFSKAIDLFNTHADQDIGFVSASSIVLNCADGSESFRNQTLVNLVPTSKYFERVFFGNSVHNGPSIKVMYKRQKLEEFETNKLSAIGDTILAMNAALHSQYLIFKNDLVSVYRNHEDSMHRNIKPNVLHALFFGFWEIYQHPLALRKIHNRYDFLCRSLCAMLSYHIAQKKSKLAWIIWTVEWIDENIDDKSIAQSLKLDMLDRLLPFMPVYESKTCENHCIQVPENSLLHQNIDYTHSKCCSISRLLRSLGGRKSRKIVLIGSDKFVKMAEFLQEYNIEIDLFFNHEYLSIENQSIHYVIFDELLSEAENTDLIIIDVSRSMREKLYSANFCNIYVSQIVADIAIYGIHPKENSYYDHWENQGKKKVVLVGAGLTGQKALRQLQNRGVQVDCFADNSNAIIGTTIANIPVIAIDDITQFDNVLAIVCSSGYNEILKQLLLLGVYSVIDYRNFENRNNAEEHLEKLSLEKFVNSTLYNSLVKMKYECNIREIINDTKDF